MKQVFLWVVLLPFVVFATDQPDGTIIGPGPVSGHFSADGSPYIVVGDIFVPENYVLDIYEGVELIFDGPYSFDVFGHIRAWGKEDQMITFTSNDPETGWKGIHLLGDGTWGSMTSFFRNCVFNYGRAGGGPEMQDHSGGALYVEGHFPLLILGCTFTDNYAVGGATGTSAGGGALAIMNCEFSATVIINDCFFQGNVCDNIGGAISIVNSLPEITGNDISGNSAMKGGAVYFSTGSDALFRNNSLLGNTASLQGGAIYARGDSDPDILNSILWGNMATEGEQIYLEDGSSDPNIRYSSIQMQDNCIGGPGSGFNYNGQYSNNSYRQPLCIQSASGSHQLTLCSPCIDAGDPDPAYIDPDGTRNDIGAAYFDHVGTYLQEEYINGTLAAVAAPYWMNNDLLISEGQELIVEPGVEMRILGRYQLKVKGKLLAVGTEDDPILMGAHNRDMAWRGIHFTPESGAWGMSKLEHCIIEYARSLGGEDPLDNKGGGVKITGTDHVTLDNTVIRFCEADGEETMNNSYSGGGGIYIQDAAPLIRHCEVVDNVAGDYGGGIAVVDASPTIHHTLLARNKVSGERGGGGIYVGGVSSPKFTNLTITANEAPLGGGFFAEEIISTLFRNTILAFNVAEEGHEVYLMDDACDPHFHYCDIIGGSKEFGGPGIAHFSGNYVHVMNADPIFKSDSLGMYNLLYASPCRDAGDPHTRADPDGTRSEIGAYYFPTMAPGNSGNYGTKAISDDLSFNCRIFPNPCIKNAYMKLEMPYDGIVRIKVYNSAGLEVADMVDARLEAGHYEWQFSMQNYPKGIYYVSVRAGNELETLKLIH